LRHFRKAMFLVLVTSLLSLFTCTAFAEDEIAKITDVQITGNKKVETETIRSKMSIKAGDLFSPSRVRTDIDAIYKMGYFDDVQVDAEGFSGGLRLTFNVVERPLIKSISYEGNEKLDKDKLREKINLTAYSVYNPVLVEENVQKLKLFYQSEGYFNAEVLPITSETTKNEVKVIFRINEGNKVYISNIEIVGNEKISTRKIKKVMSTKKHIFLWSWITKSGTYKLVEFEQDLDRIRSLYYNNGYIQVEIGEPQVVLTDDKTSLGITIPIHEGEQFKFDKLAYSGNKVFTTEELQAVIQCKPGEVMDRDLLKDDILAMTDLYGTKGYAFASITPVVNPNVEKRTVDITFDVSEGEQIYVNRINISGNEKTRDKVIRRELKFDEGEIYDTSGLKKSYDRLKNLDFFEEVEILPNRREKENTIDLDVKVKEKPTGSFSIGGGYSTIDRLVAIGEITQNNFLGLGETLKFKGEFGARRQNYVLSFIEPWLFDRPISLGLDLVKEERVYTGYTKRSTGGGITLGRRFWEYYGASLSYSYSSDSYTNVDDALVAAYPAGSFDPSTTSKIGLSLYRDTRDNYLDPRRGSRNEFYTEYASSLLGSKNEFYKAIVDSTWFFPFYWDTAFSLHGKAGYAGSLGGKLLPLYERFYVGGLSTVRGYDWGALGPKTSGDPTGGDKEIIYNAEYTFPLLTEIKLRGVAFFDSGSAFGFGQKLQLRSSYGAGFRWASPMGLIRLEYGRVLAKKPDEKSGKWEFSIGTMF